MDASAGDNAWILTSSALVLLMTPGLAFFYGGLVNDLSIINTMMMSIICMGIVSILWAVIGYSLAFDEACWFIGGGKYVLLRNLDKQVSDGIWSLIFAIFQMTFAIITAAITSGSLVQRIRFRAYVIFIGLWSLCVYCPLCHWVWGPGGWMHAMGARDFAGGTVVHISSGTSGLVAAWLLGPRLNRGEDKPHNVPFVLLGGCLLWFGWTGFNAGSALAADDIAARAITNTYLCASTSMITWVLIESVRKSQPSSVGAIVGAVAGLVVITPAAGFVTTVGAMIMGLLGAPVCFFAVDALNRFEQLDDTLDAFGLHGVGGLTGGILTGFFDAKLGFFYGGGWRFVGIQVAGVLSGMAYAAAVTFLIFRLLMVFMRVRVLDTDESTGVDLVVHGESAYFGKSLANTKKEGSAGSEDTSEQSGAVTN